MRHVAALVVVFVAVAHAQAPPARNRLAWVDRSGRVTATIGQGQWSLLYPSLSPDATSIAVRGQEADKAAPHVWIFEVPGGASRRLTRHAANEGQPAWSPKGDRVAYLSYRNGLGDIFIRAADGSGEDQQVTSSTDLHDFAPGWAPDEKHLVFHTQDPKTSQRNVMFLSLSGDRTPQPVTTGQAQEALASFSPDGRYLAYSSNESGRWEIYVITFPDRKNTWKVSPNGGIWPKWSARGNELFFFEGTSLMALPVQLTPAFKPGSVQKLFTAEQVGMDAAAIRDFNPTYDVTRDGQRFVVVQVKR
jgi:Tol biopolymer transport system component